MARTWLVLHRHAKTYVAPEGKKPVWNQIQEMIFVDDATSHLKEIVLQSVH